jgi:hypothetical protein
MTDSHITVIDQTSGTNVRGITKTVGDCFWESYCYVNGTNYGNAGELSLTGQTYNGSDRTYARFWQCTNRWTSAYSYLTNWHIMKYLSPDVSQGYWS